MTKKNKVPKAKFDYKSILKVLPLILIIAVVPLIVFLKVVPTDKVTEIFTNGNDNIDFFSYYKMQWLLIFTGLGLMMYLIKFLTSREKPIVRSRLYYPMTAYIALTVISTSFSTYKDVALWGFVDRYEGMLVLIAYLCITFLALNMTDSEKQLKVIIMSLGISAIIMVLLGFTQFIGKDFLMTDIGKKLILPMQYEHLADQLNFTFAESKAIYATLYNINYVGVYMSVIFALSSTISLLTKDNKLKVFFLTLSLLSFITILGSRSRAALFGIIFYSILALILFRKYIKKSWKPVSIVLALSLTILIGINFVRNNFITDRFVSGIKSIITVSNADFKDIQLQDNKAIIVFEDYSFTVESDGDSVLFLDKENQPIEMSNIDGYIVAKKAPYDKHRFQLATHRRDLVIDSYIMTNRGERNIKLVLDDGTMKAMYYNNDYITDIKAPYWGFEGREQMASNRGYIWSRTLPIIKDTIVIGHGPDTYAIHFPNTDYVGKFLGFSSINTIVDKPHNLYLQIAVNTGLLSLISLMILWGSYFVSAIRIHLRKQNYETFTEIAGLGIFMAVAVYLFTGLTNDSLVSVAPVFWILLGLGLWTNNQIILSLNNSKK